LKLEGQQIQTAQGLEGFKNGDRLMIAVRPEQLSFTMDREKENVLDCTIENITFLGSIVRIQANVGGSAFYVDTFRKTVISLLSPTQN